ncbi:hypothetical protein ACJMK2_038123, partial [Sinanodonta woodiana]
RNYAIDPNADVYFVSKLDDGRTFLEKAQTLKEENGNIQIEDRNYDLHPAETDITSRDLLDVPDLGARYVLRPQQDIQRDIPVTHKGNGKHVYHVEMAVVLDSTIWN